MAAATVALAAVGIVEIKARRQDTSQRTGRLDAAARYYAMLVQRSTHEAFKKLQRLLDDTSSQAVHNWHAAMKVMSARLPSVQADLAEMVKAAIERHGGTTAGLVDILDHFYQAADAVNYMASEHLDNLLLENARTWVRTARDRLFACWQAVEREFNLAAHPEAPSPPAPKSG